MFSVGTPKQPSAGVSYPAMFFSSRYVARGGKFLPRYNNREPQPMPRYYLNNFFTARARAQASQRQLQSALTDMTQGCARDNRDHVDVDFDTRIHMENNAVHSGQMYPSYLPSLTDAGYVEKN